jgi:hypothetical protein
MQLRNLISAPAQDEQVDNQRDEQTTAGRGGRLADQLRSGRLAIGTGAVWIVRALRSPQKRGRQLALGTVALGVGLLQRRARRENEEVLSSSEYTEKATRTAKEVKEGVEEETGMTAVELGESGQETEESPEDMQSDMEASGEMTEDEEDFGLDEESDVGTDEHETDIGTAPEGEEGDVDLDTGESDEETGTDFDDETEEIGTDETAAETDADDEEETEE